MDNYDYQILKYICEFGNNPSEPLCMSDIELKFGTAGRTAAVSLCRERLVFWESSDDDGFCHDNYGKIRATDKGILANERYKYNGQLKNGEQWKERIIGFISGVFVTVVAELIIRLL